MHRGLHHPAKLKLLPRSVEKQEENQFLNQYSYICLCISDPHLSSGHPRYWKPSSQLLSLTISDGRNSLNYSSESISISALNGYSLFFDDLMPRDESVRWFEDVLPKMAALLLNLPSLLESHYREAHNVNALKGMLLFQGRDVAETSTCLRLLDSQQPGLVLLSRVSI